MIKTSIIVPVYNDPQRIQKLLYQLVNQSYDNFEIIICDNGSTDSTLQIVQNYCTKYPDLVQIVSENKIQSSYAARNKGIKISKGEILAFTDSDCLPELNWLEEGVKALYNNNVNCGGGKISFFFKHTLTISSFKISIGPSFSVIS